jgi:hypothetical protein
MGFHPETLLWASRVHPDALLLLCNSASVGFFALYIQKNNPKALYCTTVFSALSASTKLVGFFLMIPMGLYLLYQDRHQKHKAFKNLAIHAGIFIGLFILFNPRLLWAPREIIEGFITQHKRNRHDGASHSFYDWWLLFLGPTGLGLSGTLCVFLGTGWVLKKRNPLELVGVLIFALLLLGYLISQSSLVLARYAVPGLWPLFWTGIAGLYHWMRPYTWRQTPLWVILAVLFFWKDWPQRAQIIQSYPYAYTAVMEKALPMTAAVKALYSQHPGSVVGHHRVFVPHPIPWYRFWHLNEAQAFINNSPISPSATILIISPEWKKDPIYGIFPQKNSEWIWADQIQGYELYVRKNTPLLKN